MIATRNEITRFIPQRPPLVMIHELVEVNESYAITQFEILPDNVFVENGYFQEPGLVENIAQTAAAHIGYIFDQQKMPIPIGYIASVKDLKVTGLPPSKSTITTKIEIVNKVLDVTLIEGSTTYEGETICKCEMRIFVKK